MHVAKLSNGKLVELLRHCATVRFDPTPDHWCLVASPLNTPRTSGRKTAWWVPVTSIVWHLNFSS